MIKATYSILFILSFLGAVGVVAPAIKDVLDMNKSIELHENKIKVNERYIDKIEGLINKREEYASEIEKVKNILPDNPEISALFSFLEDTARSKKMRIENLGNFKSIKKEEEDFFKEVNFNFILEGSYEMFKEFITEVEKSERLVEINKIEIEEAGVSNIFTINATAYYHKE